MYDPKLTALPRALDNAVMQPILLQVVASHLPTRPLSCAVQHRILKHKPGKHCVIEYTLRYHHAEHPASYQLIGKLYREQRGAERFAIMRMLWAAARQQPAAARPGIPEPLAYLPELGMLLMSRVSGKDLYSLRDDKEFGAAVEKTAGNLAKLHALHLPGLKRPELADHLQKFCRPGPEALAAAYPACARTIQQILDKLAVIDQAEWPTVPVHGDLNFGQVIIDQNQTTFIDLDGLCMAHPALDIGNLLAAVRVYYPEQYRHLERKFIETYLQYQPPTALGGLPEYLALAFFRRAMICYRKSADAGDTSTAMNTEISALLELAITQPERPVQV